MTSLQAQDVTALEREPSIAAVLRRLGGRMMLFIVTMIDGNLSRENANFFPVRNSLQQEGYPFTQSDVDSFNHVAVIGVH